MFDKYLKSIIEDEQTRMYLATAVIIYLMYFTNLVSNQMKQMLKQPLLKVSALAGIAYLSTKNFEGALMLTIIFFATITCSSSNLESFNLLEKTVDPEDTEKITYSLNPMNTAISTSKDQNTPSYSILNQGVYGGATKQMLEGIALPADNDAGREFDGKCYRATVGVAAAAETTNKLVNIVTEEGGIGDQLAGVFGFGGNSGNDEGFDPNNKVLEGLDLNNPRCGPNLVEVDKCAANESGYPTAPGEAFKACAAAHAMREVQVCQFTDVNGKCLEEEGGNIVDNCDDPNSSLCEAPKLAQAAPIESTTGPFESLNIENVKSTYLQNIPDRTKAKVDAEGNIVKKLGTNQKRDVKGNLIYKVVNSEGTRFEKPAILSGAFLNKPVRKLNSSFEYSYDWDDKDADESIVLINVKNIQSGEVKNIDNIDVSEDALYFLPGNEKVKNSEGKFVDKDGNSTAVEGNEISESDAVDKMHPKFQNPVMESEVIYETSDLYSYVKPFDAGVSLDRYIYNPDAVSTYEEAAKLYSENKLKWENSTAKKIMRTIGCHRLRDPATQHYGYWNSDEGKCAYEAIDQTNTTETTQAS